MDHLQKYAHAFRVHVNTLCTELESIANDTQRPDRLDAMQMALVTFGTSLDASC